MVEGIGESLFSFIRIICKGLEGQSGSLDNNLSKLRTHMMNSEAEIPHELVNAIEQDIGILHLERHENSQDFIDIATGWQRSLRSFGLDEAQKKVLQNIGIDFKESTNNAYQLPPKFKALLELQLAVGEIAFTVAVVDNTQIDSLKSTADEIIQLLRQITPSKQSSSNYADLINQLETGLDIDTLPSVIVKITQFIESALAVKGDDFSRYLQGLNKQLFEVQGFLSKTQTVDCRSAKVRHIADGKVRDSVASIRQKVQQATEVEVLQKQLAVQLNQIVGAMDSLQNEERNRENHLLDNYNALKQRVSSMEKEAEKVQEFVKEERKQARQDALTGLPNRSAYNEIMAHQIENCKRYNQVLSLIVCDLDHFKHVNDSYGHLAGDKVLSLVAKILCKGTRSADFVTRYGGEEFAIVIPSTHAEQAAKAMDKIRRNICKSPFNYKGEPISISMSFGVSEARADDSIESLFSRADEALYKAKESGRNKVVIG